MYFSRFKQELLQRAVGKETISTDEFCCITEFYNHDKMRISKSDYELLSRVMHVEIQENVENSDIVVARIKQYPWSKKNCLHFAPSKPRHWKFLDEMYENALFEYTVGVPCGKLVVDCSVNRDALYDHRTSVASPTPVSLDDFRHASGHGVD